MIEMIKSYENRIKIGAQQSYKNLTMFPLLSSYTISGNNLTIIERLSNCNTEQNGSNHDAIRNYGNGLKLAAWDYIEQFARVDDQIGAIFLINGKLAGIVRLHSPEAFKYSFIKIVENYARKADDEYDPKIDPKSSKFEMMNFLKTPVDSGIEIQSAARA